MEETHGYPPVPEDFSTYGSKAASMSWTLTHKNRIDDRLLEHCTAIER